MRKFFIRHKACVNWIALCFFIISGYSSAVVFGDGNSENGIETNAVWHHRHYCRTLAPFTVMADSEALAPIFNCHGIWLQQ